MTSTSTSRRAKLKEFGAGVQISPNGTRALHALGVLEALQRLSCNTEGKEVRLWNTGRTWKLFDLGTEAIARYGFPYVTVFRPDLLQVLVDAVRARKPDAIHLGRRVAGVTQHDGRVTLQFDGGATVEGDAADRRRRRAFGHPPSTCSAATVRASSG